MITTRWALEHVREIEEQQAQATEEQRYHAELEESRAGLIVTTTNSVQGRRITEYLDILAAEVLQDAAFEYRQGRGITDVIGITSQVFRRCFRQAKASAIAELREQAVDMGADAVVGVHLDYMPVSSSLVMVTVRGTAVRLAPAGNEAVGAGIGTGDEDTNEPSS